MKIPFNKPYKSGKELEYIEDAISRGKISGDGHYTKMATSYFEEKMGFKKVLLTTSCTDALEMSALLIDLKPGDEFIAPSFTFVSTVNPFILRGAKPVFIDSTVVSPNMDISLIEQNITSKTKAIIVVHYAGIACDMDAIMEIADKHNLWVVEDAAQCIDSYYKGKQLGSFGQLSAFSFHETKNIISGEGGMIVINDPKKYERAEIIREKGTNRSMFFRGEVDKYGWVDVGSSFLMSDINAAYLYAQLENLRDIQDRRIAIWNKYESGLKVICDHYEIDLPYIPHFATNNGHLFYLITPNEEMQNALLSHLKAQGIMAVFHYQALHESKYFLQNNRPVLLPFASKYSRCLLRLPLFYELSESEQDWIIEVIIKFFKAL